MIYDVVVIGSGIAGLMAAIAAKSPTNKVALLSKGHIIKSNSAMASGGINATINQFHSTHISKHIKDTSRSALGLGIDNSISFVCNQAPKALQSLEQFGVVFDRGEDKGILQRSFGGGSAKRTCFVGDKTGGAIIQALLKKAQEMGVVMLPNHFVMNLSINNKTVGGVVVLRREDSSVLVYPAKSVVIAGGGYAGIYRGFSTNASDFTGDLLAVALRANLRLQDMEFVQFHPTGFSKTQGLVSEAARAEGGYLLNSKGDRFVDELTSRDILAREIYSQTSKNEDVFLDLRHLGREKIEKRLPSLYKQALMQAGIDITAELLPIKPVAHYTMGGIETYGGVKTEIKGLFVCGESACSGMHGANRLGGNSLLEGAVYGELAGKMAYDFSLTHDFVPVDYRDILPDVLLVDKIFRSQTTKNFNAMRVSLGRSMFENVGIIRDSQGLLKAYDYISYLRSEVPTLHTVHKERTNNVELVAILELRNALMVAESVILAAMQREESRGAHFRSDFPQADKKYEKSFVVREIKKGAIRISSKEKRWLRKLRVAFETKAI